MDPDIVPPDADEKADGKPGRNKLLRAAINAVGGAIPLAGGLFAAAAGIWGETEQERAMEALRSWMKMLEEELQEKQETIVEIIARLDMHDEKINERVRSSEYQSLLKKAFRNWAGTESRKKQEYIRNVLTNAAATRVVTDDVISLFIEWLQDYSEFHFEVIGELYRNPGSTRAAIWENLGKGHVREDSAESDLFKLLIHDLSTGRIIRQHRETDYEGNFIAKRAPQKRPRMAPGSTRTMKSAFDDVEQYELTALGAQFVHYAMTELTIKIPFYPSAAGDEVESSADAIKDQKPSEPES